MAKKEGNVDFRVLLFAENLKRYRKKKEWSQEHLGKLCQVHARSIGWWENALYSPNLSIVFRLADVFGIKPEDFWAETEEKEGKR